MEEDCKGFSISLSLRGSFSLSNFSLHLLWTCNAGSYDMQHGVMNTVVKSFFQSLNFSVLKMSDSSPNSLLKFSLKFYTKTM